MTERLGREAQLHEQFEQELRGRTCIAPSLHKEIENIALVVDRARQSKNQILPAIRTAILIELPLRGWPMTSAAKLPGEQRPELQHPTPDRFVGDVQPALGEQILDVAEAEGEAKVQPYRMPDDVRRELVASE